MTLSITKKDLNLLVNLSDDDLVITMRLIHQLQHKKLDAAREHYHSNTDYLTTEVRELLDRKFEKAARSAEAAAERRRQPRKPKTEVSAESTESAEPVNTVTTPFTQEFMDFLKKEWYRFHNFFHSHEYSIDAVKTEYDCLAQLLGSGPQQTFIDGYEDKRIHFQNGRLIRPIFSSRGRNISALFPQSYR